MGSAAAGPRSLSAVGGVGQRWPPAWVRAENRVRARPRDPPAAPRTSCRNSGTDGRRAVLPSPQRTSGSRTERASRVRVLGFPRSSCRYASKRRPLHELTQVLRDHAATRPRFGYRRLHVLLGRTGGHVNHKRVYRLYRAEGLAVRRRSDGGLPLDCVWSCQHRQHRTSDGRWTSSATTVLSSRAGHSISGIIKQESGSSSYAPTNPSRTSSRASTASSA